MYNAFVTYVCNVFNIWLYILLFQETIFNRAWVKLSFHQTYFKKHCFDDYPSYVLVFSSNSKDTSF